MAKKIEDITNDLTQYINKIENSITKTDAAFVALSVKQRMLGLIAKGISPILGAGRFPEYKALSALNSQKRKTRVLRNTLRNGTKRNKAQLRRAISSSKRKESQLRKGYPFSVQDKYPNKKPRPVNLFLSGDFLSNLDWRIKQNAKNILVEIGFYDKPSKQKESGHRDGVNGQPKRPIIPQGAESFNRIVTAEIMKIVKAAVARAKR
jgi:hypothetical protein